ncbi:hypothetical protein TNCV_2793711 [Trichonephila clavipes]|nr:hypothetical protein TNCV_2793711 [Trichonephila clavipes]
MAAFCLNGLNDCLWGIRQRHRHGQQSSHNHIALPLMPWPRKPSGIGIGLWLALPRVQDHDEAHFWLNGYVNKQNCRIWSEANPQVYVETPLHPEKLTVWCALWAGGIIGPYFFKNDEGHNVTVNGDRYRAMITNFSFLN